MLSYKSGLDRATVVLMDSLLPHSVGPATTHHLLQDLGMRDYDIRRLQYADAIKYRFMRGLTRGQQPHEFPLMPERPHHISLLHCPPSASYLKSMLMRHIESLEEPLAQQVRILEGTHLHGDGAFKIIKRTAKGSLGMCWTATNEFNEIRLQVLTLSKSLEHLKPALLAMQASLAKHGLPNTQYITVDNPLGEGPALKSCLKSLEDEVIPLPPMNLSGMPEARLPDQYSVKIFDTVETIEQAAESLLFALEQVAPELKMLGFDTEWPTEMQNFRLGLDPPTQHFKPALIQLASEDTAYLFRVYHLDYLPPSLVSLLESQHIFKIGHCTANDVSKLRQHFNVECNQVIDLVKLCRLTNLIVDRRKTPSLAQVCALALGKYLPKPDDIRQSRWDLALSRRHLDYAALDALVSLQIFINVSNRQQFNLKVALMEEIEIGEAILLRENNEVQFCGEIAAWPEELPPGRTHQLTVQEPSDGPGLSPSTTKLSVNQMKQSYIKITHVNVPSYTLSGYTRALQHANLPFFAVANQSLLYTRPATAFGDLLNDEEEAADDSLDNQDAVREMEELEASVALEEDAAADGLSIEDPSSADDEDTENLNELSLLESLPQPPAQDLLDSNAPPASSSTASGRPTRVLMDLVHLMFRLAPSAGAPTRSIFLAKLRDTLFTPNRHDKRAVLRFLNRGKEKALSWEEWMCRKPNWILKRVRRHVEPPQSLFPRVKTLLE